MKINRYTRGIDEMMDHVISSSDGNDLVYELAVLADTARALTTEEASHRVMYNFILTNYKNKHPYVQFLVRRVQNLLDTLQLKRRGVVQLNGELIDFIKYSR